MIISMIAAIDEKQGMGYKNNLLCHLPRDLLWFKKRTKNKPVIMGKNTAISLGKPLPNRQNIVVSKTGWRSEGFVTCSSPSLALEAAATWLDKRPSSSPFGVESDTLDGWLFDNLLNETMIIGGAQIYKEFMDSATNLDITHIHKEFPADVFFPEFSDFTLRESCFFAHQEGVFPSFTIARYHKKG